MVQTALFLRDPMLYPWMTNRWIAYTLCLASIKMSFLETLCFTLLVIISVGLVYPWTNDTFSQVPLWLHCTIPYSNLAFLQTLVGISGNRVLFCFSCSPFAFSYQVPCFVWTEPHSLLKHPDTQTTYHFWYSAPTRTNSLLGLYKWPLSHRDTRYLFPLFRRFF